MTDIARLGITVDSRSAKSAAGDLGKLTRAAAGADASVDGLKGAASVASPALAKAGVQARAAGQQMRGAGMHTSNLAAQFNDIGVMLAAGQSPLMLALQQGTQINQVFDQMGKTGQSRMGVLASAFASVVSPANLMTIGVIAAGAAVTGLVFNMVSAGDEADNLEDALDNLGSTMDQLQQPLDILQTGIEELRDTYGEAAERVRRFAIFQADLRVAQATDDLKKQFGIVKDLADEYSIAATGGHALRTTLNRIVGAFDVTRKQAIQLGTQFKKLGNAPDLDGQRAALENIQTMFGDIGVEADKIPSSIAEALDVMVSYSNKVDAATQLTKTLASATENIGNVDDEERAKRLKKLSDEAQNFIRRTRTEQERLTADIAKVNDLKEKGVLTDEKALEIVQRLRDAQKDAPAKISEDQREAARWIDQTRTAAEKYANELARLETLNEGGFFKEAPEAYARAVKQVGDEFERANDRAARSARDLAAALQDARDDAALSGLSERERILHQVVMAERDMEAALADTNATEAKRIRAATAYHESLRASQKYEADRLSYLQAIEDSNAALTMTDLARAQHEAEIAARAMMRTMADASATDRERAQAQLEARQASIAYADAIRGQDNALQALDDTMRQIGMDDLAKAMDDVAIAQRELNELSSQTVVTLEQRRTAQMQLAQAEHAAAEASRERAKEQEEKAKEAAKASREQADALEALDDRLRGIGMNEYQAAVEAVAVAERELQQARAAAIPDIVAIRGAEVAVKEARQNHSDVMRGQADRLEEIRDRMDRLGMGEHAARVHDVVIAERELEELRRSSIATAEELKQAEYEVAAAKQAITDKADEADKALAGRFSRAITEAESFEDALKNVLLQLAEVAAQGFFEGAFGADNAGESGGGLGKFFGNLGASLFAADGAAFAHGGQHVTAFARGGVVDRTTPFSFGGGRLGVMGEAGPEAIMPLQRGADGKLGIAAGGQPSQPINVENSFDVRVMSSDPNTRVSVRPSRQQVAQQGADITGRAQRYR